INRLIDECINKHNQRLSHGGRGDGGEYGLSHKGKTREIIVLRRKCYNGHGVRYHGRKNRNGSEERHTDGSFKA
ncbi:hypothetical protein M1N66_02155, partial [Thermodesulfovibrionales bacterium]|nr:hypothetical protein [Thermodesulfovibrionales bacterium]